MEKDIYLQRQRNLSDKHVRVHWCSTVLLWFVLLVVFGELMERWFGSDNFGNRYDFVSFISGMIVITLLTYGFHIYTSKYKAVTPEKILEHMEHATRTHCYSLIEYYQSIYKSGIIFRLTHLHHGNFLIKQDILMHELKLNDFRKEKVEQDFKKHFSIDDE